MKLTYTLLSFCLLSQIGFSQNDSKTYKTPVMTLGVFHFAYPNRDAVKTKKEDQISVLDEPYQSEIVAICKAIEEFNPTVIALEIDPSVQHKIDSLYNLYKMDKFQLKKNEIFQLGFRMAKNLNLSKLYCVNDWGRYYAGLEDIFKDSARLARFEHYYNHFPDSAYALKETAKRVESILAELKRLNAPERIKQRLSVYLLNPFKYEETPGDFTGVDFETSRWFSRNLRIFRNVQRIEREPNDGILIIMGADHLNLLNIFFDVSNEFELVSPMPYLDKVKTDNFAKKVSPESV
jgi:hypothetical protein